jgi:preprotein translocase subunit SecB
VPGGGWGFPPIVLRNIGGESPATPFALPSRSQAKIKIKVSVKVKVKVKVKINVSIKVKGSSGSSRTVAFSASQAHDCGGSPAGGDGGPGAGYFRI